MTTDNLNSKPLLPFFWLQKNLTTRQLKPYRTDSVSILKTLFYGNFNVAFSQLTDLARNMFGRFKLLPDPSFATDNKIRHT
jgi:hypothetical protein